VSVEPLERRPIGCALWLGPKAETETSDQTPPGECQWQVFAEVRRQPLSETAIAAGFKKVKGVWHYRPGTIFDSDSAEDLQGSGWSGLHGASTSHYCGAAQSTSDFALGTPVVSVHIQAHETLRQVLDQILPTIEFLK
jgi:hypothetical protein